MTTIATEDGTRLYLKDWGKGRPVVFIHGWPLSADSWDELAAPIAAAGYRCVAYDRRGFGRSDQPIGGYDYDTLSDDLAKVVEYTGARDVTLVGFSMGGGEVARYMSRHQGRAVRSVALVSSVVPQLAKTADHPQGVDASVFAEMRAGMERDRASFFAGFFKQFFGVSVLAHPVSKERLAWAERVAMDAAYPATLACADAFATTDFRSDLPWINVPTLIVHGTADQTVPIDATGRAAARALRSAELRAYDGAPHGLFVTHREALLEDLLRLLAR